MKRLLALAILALTLCGCTAAAQTGATEFAPPEENRLTVFTCLEESVYAPLVKEFEERTGIWVQVETGSAQELMARIAGGESGCDLLLGCEADYLEANGALFLELEEMDGVSAYCPRGARWAPLSLRSLVIIYNPKLVRQNPPGGWDSLLSAAWQGKIAFADPETSDFSLTALAALTQRYPEQSREETLSAFAANLDTLLEDTREVVSRVADGSYCLAVVPEDAALRRIDSGESLAIVYPREGTYLIADCAAVPADCAHPENARAFLAFALGEDAQSHAWEAWGRGSVLETLTRLPENCLTYDAAAAGAGQSGLLDAWRLAWRDEA